MNNNIADQDKLLRFLFLNLVYLLKESREVIKYEDPQYGNAEKGFAVTMFKVANKAYYYATECFRLLGKEPVRECSVTMSVNFDTAEEKNAFKDHFRALLNQAENELGKMGTLTPHEYYFLKCAPVIVGTEDAPSGHYVLLQATILDDLDRRVCEDVLGDCEIGGDVGMVAIKVSCYRKKWRDQLVRYLRTLGIEENTK